MDYQQPQPQLSQPQLLAVLVPKPLPPQHTRMSIKIMIQVQLFPPKQLLHIKKTPFFVFNTYYAPALICVTGGVSKKFLKKFKKVFDFS